jgi:hypothetical protein
MKLGFDAGDHCRGQEFAIGINDEQIARPVEDDASAWPVFVFVRPACSNGTTTSEDRLGDVAGTGEGNWTL